MLGGLKKFGHILKISTVEFFREDFKECLLTILGVAVTIGALNLFIFLL